MNPRSILVALLSTLVPALALAGPAAAKPAPVKPPAGVAIGKLGVSAVEAGRASILVPVRYPIQLAGRRVQTRVALLDPHGRATRSWGLRDRLSGGRVRHPDRRRAFTFVHRVSLNERLTRRLRRQPKVRVVARAILDLDGDGRAELRSSDRTTHAPTSRPRKKVLCSSIPHLRVEPGGRVSVPLPACDAPRRWHVLRERAPGFTRVVKGRLVYRAPQRFRGRLYLQLSGRGARTGAGASAQGEIGFVQLTVGATPGVVVRALGDSVTAGFGFYSNGSSMTIGRLLQCRPAAKEFNDACSSNSMSSVSKEEKEVDYAPDYGLANNVSWAAQWANSYGVGNYKNFAISGSEPKNWAPGGEFQSTTEQIASEDPDYILMTMGANPLLSNMLFGFDNMGCAIYADVFGSYQRCVEEAFAAVDLREHLTALYSYLVANTDATIYLMQYHLSVPSTALAYSATQIAAMGALLNREIAAVAAAVDPRRLQVVAPPHFDVGIDVSPVFPSRYTCSSFGYRVDGPSVQSEPTQDELEVLHPLSFCEGPEGGEAPWVISGDTGIHPSANGYRQMASQVPAPSRPQP